LVMHGCVGGCEQLAVWDRQKGIKLETLLILDRSKAFPRITHSRSSLFSARVAITRPPPHTAMAVGQSGMV
jgi:hypothetical protein